MPAIDWRHGIKDQRAEASSIRAISPIGSLLVPDLRLILRAARLVARVRGACRDRSGPRATNDARDIPRARPWRSLARVPRERGTHRDASGCGRRVHLPRARTMLPPWHGSPADRVPPLPPRARRLGRPLPSGRRARLGLVEGPSARAPVGRHRRPRGPGVRGGHPRSCARAGLSAGVLLQSEQPMPSRS